MTAYGTHTEAEVNIGVFIVNGYDAKRPHSNLSYRLAIEFACDNTEQEIGSSLS